MSVYQQIRVRVEPVYKKGLAKAFPRLHRVLSGVDNRLLEDSPPLYDLVETLVDLSHASEPDPQVARAVAEHGPAIVSLRRRIEEAIGGWRLSQAEKLLYELEEAFAALEKDLPVL